MSDFQDFSKLNNLCVWIFKRNQPRYNELFVVADRASNYINAGEN